ncbi:fungal-specific transcription factor domain-containing protein [Xylaria arbuscula]|nr:fungal-specific transcription factor domain-containing protein [Xylaria arbuscula]
MPPQDRARVVCTNCHSRKIKCDLQTSSSGVCTHCRQSQQSCIRRVGARKTRATAARLRGPRSRPDHFSPTTNPEPLSPGTASLHPVNTTPVGSGSTPSSQTSRFVSRCSNSYYEELDNTTVVDECAFITSSRLQDAVLKSTQAHTLPRSVLLNARVDAYLKHAFHYCPVLEDSDLNGSASITLQKAVCLVGNLMRHDPRGPELANELYEEVKLLIYINYDKDTLQILKALCLLSLWSAKPSNPITLDVPWHWIGVAVRLAFQMGLHRESAYVNQPDAKCLRRIFWTLYNSDTLEATCWNRPALLRRNDFDVELPTLDDFNITNVQSLVFVESSKLCTLISRISVCCRDRQSLQPQEFSKIEESLYAWASNLPEQVQLFDKNGKRKSYDRPVSELLIQYFTAVVLGEFLKYRDNGGPRRVSVVSLLAASCATALYDEISCRDEAMFLTYHNAFYCLVLALPLIHHIPRCLEKQNLRERDLAALQSILNGMNGRCGNAEWAIGRMQHLKTSIDRATNSQRSGNSDRLEPYVHASRLFPFPSGFCENMALLEQTIPTAEVTIDNLDTLQNWPIDSNANYAWLDLFSFDVTDMGPDFGDGNN